MAKQLPDSVDEHLKVAFQNGPALYHYRLLCILYNK